MPPLEIVRDSAVQRTARVMQMEGIFDVPPSARSAERWTVDLDLSAEWQIGVVVGPSGAGKSTIARALWPDALVSGWDWPPDQSVLDGFPAGMSIKEIVGLLSSVGFSSPPSWVRPFRVLSNGEQFRVSLARTLAERPDLAVVDEFTSVVDRTVAQIGSAAVAKTVRRRGGRFIAVTCHYDVLDWLEPDWVYEPHVNRLARDRLCRPPITLTIQRVHHSAWQLFRKHHYLDTALNVSATCFVASWAGVPVAFSAWLSMPSGTLKNAKREHRTVCLPDFQGVGIGNALSKYCAAGWAALGYVPISTTSHPAMIRSRAASPDWRLHRLPGTQFHAGAASVKHLNPMGKAWREKAMRRSDAASRITAGFRYVGAALDRAEAERVWAA